MFSIWIPVKDGDPSAFQLMKRHYTYHPHALRARRADRLAGRKAVARFCRVHRRVRGLSARLRQRILQTLG